jgi:hypothetical protein
VDHFDSSINRITNHNHSFGLAIPLDFITAFMAETETIRSTPEFRLWSAITAISGALERKVWSYVRGPLYPNLFTVLVGLPGSGKTQAIEPVRELWHRIKGLNVTPDNVTTAALVMALSRCMRTVESNGKLQIFTFASAASTEFGQFFPTYDKGFLSVLNGLFDCPMLYVEERITRGKVELTKPGITILSGTQPDYIGSFLPEEAWGMGFASRLTMIYSPVTLDRGDLFIGRNGKDWLADLASELNSIFHLTGQFSWDPNAITFANDWNRKGMPPVPDDHTRLQHYITRRDMLFVKLCMISSASRGRDLTVTLMDTSRAQTWMLNAEAQMPNIFRAMRQKSDAQLISDLHIYLYQEWSSRDLAKRQPIPDENLSTFLHNRVPSERIRHVIDVAERSGAIRRGVQTFNGRPTWIPRPYNLRN